MKVYIICTCLGIWAFDLMLRSNPRVLVDAQGHNISKTYKPIEFEWTHRGSFNISYCSKQYINCYEMFQLQFVCGYWIKRDSICSAMVSHCHDLYGDDEDFERGRIDLQDEFCYEYWWYYWWT